MNNRKDLTTQSDNFENRLNAWNSAIDACKKHIGVGISLQEQGQNLLDSIDENTDQDSAMKFLDRGVSITEKGIKIERDSRDKILQLMIEKPKGKKE